MARWGQHEAAYCVLVHVRPIGPQEAPQAASSLQAFKAGRRVTAAGPQQSSKADSLSRPISVVYYLPSPPPPCVLLLPSPLLCTVYICSHLECFDKGAYCQNSAPPSADEARWSRALSRLCRTQRHPLACSSALESPYRRCCCCLWQYSTAKLVLRLPPLHPSNYPTLSTSPELRPASPPLRGSTHTC